MDKHVLIKEYFVERLRKVFKYPFTVYTNRDALPETKTFMSSLCLTHEEIMIHLQDTAYVLIINHFKVGTLTAYFKSKWRHVNHSRDFFYDIHTEESTEKVCHDIISYAQDHFAHVAYGVELKKDVYKVLRTLNAEYNDDSSQDWNNIVRAYFNGKTDLKDYHRGFDTFIYDPGQGDFEGVLIGPSGPNMSVEVRKHEGNKVHLARPDAPLSVIVELNRPLK